MAKSVTFDSLELGHIAFGQPAQEYHVPEWFENLMHGLSCTLDGVMQLVSDEPFDNPFDNSGGSFENEVFEAHAYSWNDEEEQPYNFKCGDFMMSWYKCLGRDTTMNQDLPDDEPFMIWLRCMDSVLSLAKKYLKVEG